MLTTLLKGLPWLAILCGLGGGLLTGAPIGWFGRTVIYDTIEKPLLISTVEQRERAACTIRTMDAANRAEQAERDRQRNIREVAIAAEDRQATLRAAELVREIDTLNQEIEANEQRLVAAGKSCPLDAELDRWVRKQWGLPPPPPD